MKRIILMTVISTQEQTICVCVYCKSNCKKICVNSISTSCAPIVVLTYLHLNRLISHVNNWSSLGPLFYFQAKVYSYLLNAKQCNGSKETIQIISQYNAQCAEIKRQLISEGLQFDDENVSTVVSSQGKFY